MSGLVKGSYMLTHAQLLVSGDLRQPDNSPDFNVGIGRKVIRGRYDGARAVAVGSDTESKTQITSLLDLLDFWLTTDKPTSAQVAAGSRLSVLVGGEYKDRREALDALVTLAEVVRGPKIRILEHGLSGTFEPVDGSDFDPCAAGRRYADLLANVPLEPPVLVKQLVEEVSHPALRAYPMLAGGARKWSLRLEGLQVGVVSGTKGWLDVGKVGKGGMPGPERAHWQRRTSWLTPYHFDANVLQEAATGLRRFAETWLVDPILSGAVVVQDEHALESRILRGAVSLAADHRELQLLRPHAEVNWGSQFPTRWGRDGQARYLDGLLRDGRVPWAVEMKIQGPSGGLRQYYRHAIAQAVLYREFIKRAAPLDAWFVGRGLDRDLCRAAIVVPEMVGSASKSLDPIKRLCDLFDVSLIQVPHSAAECSRLPGGASYIDHGLEKTA